MLKTRQGRVRYTETLEELLREGSNRMPESQHDRKPGDGLIKLDNIDFRGADLSGMEFDGLLFDECDFTGANFTNTKLYKCGMRSAIIHRVQADGAQFINVNMREARFTENYAIGANFEACNMLSVNMTDSNLNYATIIGCDMRKVNLRDCRIKHALMKDNKLRGCNLRDVQFTWTNGIPRFFYDTKVNFEAADPEDWFYGYKLTAADGKGIYHPAIKYSVGKVFDAEYQDADPAKRIPISKKYNSGIALAPLDWVLREWVLCGAYGDYQCFRCKFQAKDVIENEGNTKFNVRKMEVVDEVDMSGWYEQMSEDIGYHTGGTASAISEFEIVGRELVEIGDNDVGC